MNDQLLYPYLIEPKETPAIWGGESWKCWDANRVINGALAGSTIADLRAKLREQLLGDIDPERTFPVLTKIINARDWLSVQVHPDDAYAQRVEHQPNGKTECWYIFTADDGAELVLGWTRDTTREEYERRVADGTLGELLRRVPVRAGDVFYLPAGTLHAIGAGIVLFETQQASDLTYRIFDWNRLGADGKPRELHVKKAADVLDYHRGTKGAIEHLNYRYEGLDRTALIVDPRFVVERIVASSEPASIATNARPLIIMAIEKKLDVEVNGVAVTLERNQTVLVPAAAKWCTVSASAGNEAAFMFVTPPQRRDIFPIRLLAAGVPQERIDHFMAQFA